MSHSLLRIEFKLDLIIRAMQNSGLMLPELPSLVGIERDDCPVCSKKYTVSIDVKKEQLELSCSCKPPIQVVSGISDLLNKREDQNNATSSRTQRELVPSDSAEESSSSSGRKHPSGSGSR